MTKPIKFLLKWSGIPESITDRTWNLVNLPITPQRADFLDIRDFFDVYQFTEDEIQFIKDNEWSTFKVTMITIHPDYLEIKLQAIDK